MRQLFRKISSYTGFSETDLDLIINKAPKSYKIFHISKRDGGQRRIEHPAKETKAIQHALLELLFYKIKPSSIAYAFIPNLQSPLKKNAFLHSRFKYSVRIDFKDFFHSIKPEDLKRILIKEKKNIGEIDDDDFELISSICFMKNRFKDFDHLSVGSPSSPYISNLVMLDFDDELIELKDKIDEYACVTRYADDIIFSTNKKGNCNHFLKGLTELTRKIKNPSLSINIDKTVFMSNGSKRIVTGLVITNNHQVSIGNSKKKEIRSKVYNFKKGELNDDEIKSLSGYLAFILDVEPDFYHRLTLKYGAKALESLISHN